MSIQTNPDLRRSVIYELYVRSHTPQGTFRAVEPDLPRIRALGTDILWLMPIHPIGQENRKGSMGCPYANRDYRTVNPEYGTLEDFLHLVDAIHDNGMKKGASGALFHVGMLRRRRRNGNSVRPRRNPGPPG